MILPYRLHAVYVDALIDLEDVDSVEVVVVIRPAIYVDDKELHHVQPHFGLVRELNGGAVGKVDGAFYDSLPEHGGKGVSIGHLLANAEHHDLGKTLLLDGVGDHSPCSSLFSGGNDFNVVHTNIVPQMSFSD